MEFSTAIRVQYKTRCTISAVQDLVSYTHETIGMKKKRFEPQFDGLKAC